MGVGRAQDLDVVRQIRAGEEQLPPTAIERFTTECAYREQWRTEREDKLTDQLSDALFRTLSMEALQEHLLRFSQSHADAAGAHARFVSMQATGILDRGRRKSVAGSAPGALGAYLTAMRDELQDELHDIRTPMAPEELARYRASKEVAAMAAPARPAVDPELAALQAELDAENARLAARIDKMKSPASRGAPRVTADRPDSHRMTVLAVRAEEEAKRKERAKLRAAATRDMEERAMREHEKKVEAQRAREAAAKERKEKEAAEAAVRAAERRVAAAKIITRVGRGAVARLRVKPAILELRAHQLRRAHTVVLLQRTMRRLLRWKRWKRLWKQSVALQVKREREQTVIWASTVRNWTAQRMYLAEKAELTCPREMYIPRPPFRGPVPAYCPPIGAFVAKGYGTRGSYGLHLTGADDEVGSVGSLVSPTDRSEAGLRSPSGSISESRRPSESGSRPSSAGGAGSERRTVKRTGSAARRRRRMGALSLPEVLEQDLLPLQVQLVQWDAAVALQTAARRLLGVARARRRRDSVRRLQRFARIAQSRLGMWWHARFTAHMRTRRKRAAWAASRERQMASWPAHDKLMTWFVNADLEAREANRQMEAEKERFEQAWATYEKRITKALLAKKLSPDWVPQLEDITGTTYYLNLRTGKSQGEHPNMKFVRAQKKKQRVRADAQLADRMRIMLDYRDRIVMGEAEHRRATMALAREQHNAVARQQSVRDDDRILRRRGERDAERKEFEP